MSTPTWHSTPTFHGILPITPDPVFPTVANQSFALVQSLGLSDPTGNQTGHVQWADCIPPGINAAFPHGAIVFYPWGATAQHSGSPPAADNPWSALLVFVKQSDAPTPSQLATQFTDVTNWRYYNMRTICAADPLADYMRGWGGGRLDNYTTPKYIYGAANSYLPTAPSLAATNNPVMVQMDATADWSTPGAYRTMDLRTLGLSLTDFGGQFVGGVQNGRMWYAPSLHKSPAGSCKMVLSVDVEPTWGSNYFQNAAHWHACDMGATAIGSTFGGFQGGAGLGNYMYFCQFVGSPTGYKLWQLNTAGVGGAATDAFGAHDLVANLANWKGIDPLTINGAASGYINAGVVNDATTGAPRYMVFSPYQNSTTFGQPASAMNNIALCFDTFLPAGGDFTTAANWSAIDTTTIPTGDAHQIICRGYQGVLHDNAGYGWLLASADATLDVQTAWLCWNPLYPFSEARSWKAYPSYTAWGDPTKTLPKVVCGGAFDPLTNSLYASPFTQPQIPTGGPRKGLLPVLTVTIPPNGAGVPQH